ncbi:unnamed protein product [Rotaria sp. Silwood2]|nr:unnamed protein product [Rotaria sp. Silwood2]CAF4359616.1 unnamed protein product [Rotaria sp. Silwood2]
MILWALVFTILVVYKSLAKEVFTIRVEQPTETTYEQLIRSVSLSVQCPCARLLFTYDAFVQLEAQMHQICTSQFIDGPWIESIFGDGNWSHIPTNEFRSRGVAYFLVQQSLCTLAQLTVNSTILFLRSKYIFNGQVIPKEQLLLQIKTDIDTTIDWNILTFVAIFRLGREIIQKNQLINVFSLNWVYSLEGNNQVPYYRIPTRPISHGPNCSCATSSACTEPVFIGNEIVPGFTLGCSPMESLLRSTLTCLYNQTCLNLINIRNLSFIHPLDASLPSRFMLNSTVENLTANAFVEQWLYNISYSTFYSTCQPSICTYSVSKRKDLLEVITIILGLYSGLTLILRLIAPLLISASNLVSVLVWRRNNTVVPFT